MIKILPEYEGHKLSKTAVPGSLRVAVAANERKAVKEFFVLKVALAKTMAHSK